ncbi:MAG: maleylpyruvate isomerase family mycothiol-dependent enzyme [Candidatus Dormiibacterota bacterium]
MADHVDALRTAGQRLADAAGATSCEAPVPTCPGWRLRDLLRHVGGVHRWATAVVAGPLTAPPSPEEESRLMETWGTDEQLVEWFRVGHRALLAALENAPADVACWSFLPAPSPLAFWARRQTHETTIHGFDVASAAGRPDPISTALALDGLDELVRGFLARRERTAAPRPRRLRIEATDAELDWLVTLVGERRQVEVEVAPSGGGAECTVRAPAADLYLLLWNRRRADGLDVVGDPSVLAEWRATRHVTWA